MTQDTLPESGSPSDSSLTSFRPSGAVRGSDGDVGSTRFDGASLVSALPRPLADSLHYLVARLQLSDPGMLPSPIGVVSAMHQEGVTTISQALAVVMANDLNISVCWASLSPGPPSRKRRGDAGVPPPGAFEVLTKQAALTDVIQRTGDDRLALLYPGAVPVDNWQAFARSPQIGDLIDELSSRFDLVVLDVPPVLAGSESLAILRHAAAHLMVVRHGVTTAPHVRAAAEEIRSIPSLGVVMNQFQSKIPRRMNKLFSS